jgi:hypothetical protein
MYTVKRKELSLEILQYFQVKTTSLNQILFWSQKIDRHGLEQLLLEMVTSHVLERDWDEVVREVIETHPRFITAEIGEPLDEVNLGGYFRSLPLYKQLKEALRKQDRAAEDKLISLSFATPFMRDQLGGPSEPRTFVELEKFQRKCEAAELLYQSRRNSYDVIKNNWMSGAQFGSSSEK